MSSRRFPVVVVVGLFGLAMANGTGAAPVDLSDPNQESANGLTLNWKTIEGNDCPGVFSDNGGFSNCSIEFDDQSTPSIIKFENDDGEAAVDDISTLFTTVSGIEYTINFEDQNEDDEFWGGTWSYLNNDAQDPLVTFWTAVDGSAGFNLFWLTDGGDIVTVPQDTLFRWFTPDERELSHITFYDTEGDRPPEEIPEPGILLMLGTGLLAIALLRTRRRGFIS